MAALSVRKRRTLQFLTDFATVILVSTAFLLIYLLVNPFDRGFYCTDESIRFPYRPDTIPLWVAGLYGSVSAVFVILFTEAYLFGPCCYKKQTKSEHRTRCILTSARGVFLYALGAISTLLITEIGKHTIGRLRPHFIDVCRPQWDKIDCFQKKEDGNLPNYVPMSAVLCTGDPHLVKEARLSFPSGHSSFSAYSMTFIIIYLEARMILNRMHYVKSVFQLIAFIAAWHTAMSRVSDFKHHYTDVMAGATIGIAVAIFITVVTGKRLWDPEKDRKAPSGTANEEENAENGLEFEEQPDAFNL